ncbi:MAG: succinylglutamate desuccinylase/aspartoacylase family protein [Thermoanaerobaculia bacterium]
MKSAPAIAAPAPTAEARVAGWTGAELDGAPDRVLGRRADDPAGPWLVCVAGLHGNEPAGVEAIRRVLATLDATAEPLAGAFVALAGNRAALAAGRRYLDRDLNRAWREPRLGELRAGATPRDREERELAELDRELGSALDAARGRVFFLDLHTTSGGGAPFAVLDDALPNRRFALHFPVPLVLGLEEELGGTLVFHLTARGVTCVAFEGGQHRDPESVDRCEAAVWLALEAAGVLPKALKSRAEEARRRLRASRGEVPHLVEVLYRHRITPTEQFRMRPGFASFQRVGAGQILAEDARGGVTSPRRGLILMPLYQPQGDDGFFLAVPVQRFWFELSATMRRLRADRILPWLPGIRRHPVLADSFMVDRRLARWLMREVFHLLGYRRAEADGRYVIYRRRSDPAAAL